MEGKALLKSLSWELLEYWTDFTHVGGDWLIGGSFSPPAAFSCGCCYGLTSSSESSGMGEVQSCRDEVQLVLELSGRLTTSLLSG